MGTNTGGPAFPSSQPLQPDDWGEDHTGMSIRDYFAAKAMQGLITSRHTDYDNGFYTEEQVAQDAYRMAEAMLRVRG